MLYIFLAADRSSTNRTEAPSTQNKEQRNGQPLFGLYSVYNHLKFLSLTTLSKFGQLVKK